MTTRRRAPAACGCASHSSARKAVAVDPGIKSANRKRLRRIAGQIQGIERMVEQERYCADILMQIAAVEQALRAVGKALLRNHLRHCATRAIRKGSPQQAEAMYGELVNLFARYSR
jgi:DNA-binding FrmR family transcriptional regulator